MDDENGEFMQRAERRKITRSRDEAVGENQGVDSREEKTDKL